MSWLVGLAVGLAAMVVLWWVSAAVTLVLARRRGGSTVRWAVLGLLLGPVGVFLAVRHVRPCPGCGATVLNEVRTCPACDAEIPRRDPKDNPVGPLWSYRKDW